MQHVVSPYVIKPTALVLMGINIKLHRQVFTVLNVELADTVFTKDREHTAPWVLAGNFNYILL